MQLQDSPNEALRKALLKVESQRRKLESMAMDDPSRLAEEKLLETSRQSAAFARLACVFMDDEAEREMAPDP